MPPETTRAWTRRFDLLAGDRRNYIFPVEHAGHVSEIDEMVGVDEFSAGRGHVVRIDIVEFAVGALAEARRNGKQIFAPEGFEERGIYASEIADETEAALHIVVDQRRSGRNSWRRRRKCRRRAGLRQ